MLQGYYKITMRNTEDRQLVKLIITLTDVEPGVNFKMSSFSKKVENVVTGEESYVCLNGWELPLTWLTGQFSVTYHLP
mgnify:FL=1